MTARTHDLNGFFRVRNNPISREGIFDYSGGQIGAPERDKIFKVYRPGEELSSPEALASFALMPIIDDHTMLGEGFKAADEVGVGGTIGENVQFSDGVMTADLMIYGGDLAEKIKSGKTELSCGYRCVYDFTPGVWNGQHYDVVQRRIRANHLALVNEGRMGPQVAVLDHMTFTVDAKEHKPAMDEELKELLAAIVARLEKLEATAKPEDKPAVVSDEEKAAAEAKAAKDAEEAAAAKAAEDGEGEEKPAAMDAVFKVVKSLQDQVAALSARPAMDEKTVFETLARKTSMAERLSVHVGTFDHSAMTYTDVVKYGVEKLGIKNVPAGGEAIALDGFLQARPVPAVHTATDSARSSKLGASIANYAKGA